MNRLSPIKWGKVPKKGAGKRFANTLPAPFAVTRKPLSITGLEQKVLECWQKEKTSLVVNPDEITQI